MKTQSKWWLFFGIIGILVVAFAILMPILICTGVYSLGADSPDPKPVQWVLHTVSDAGMAVGARSVTVPANLEDSLRVIRGAGMYAEMCESCHLAPGKDKTGISQGLFPHAPTFFRAGHVIEPAEAFWTTQHGIKSTGMPAWGATNSAGRIWDMVAFLQKMPGMTGTQYDSMVHIAPKLDEGAE